MKAQLYNNPLIAQGLAELVNSFIGDPMKEAQSKQMMESARLTGLRADQLEQELAGVVASGIRGTSPTGRGGAGTTAAPDATPEMRSLDGLTQTGINRARGWIEDAGYEGQDALTILNSALEDYTTGSATLDQIVLDVLNRTGKEEYEVEPGEKRSFLGMDWLRPDKDPVMGERVVVAPRTPAVGQPSGQPSGDVQAIIAEAQAAIAAGADPAAVAARLKEMGVDIGGM